VACPGRLERHALAEAAVRTAWPNRQAVLVRLLDQSRRRPQPRRLGAHRGNQKEASQHGRTQRPATHEWLPHVNAQKPPLARRREAKDNLRMRPRARKRSPPANTLPSREKSRLVQPFRIPSAGLLRLANTIGISFAPIAAVVFGRMAKEGATTRLGEEAVPDRSPPALTGHPLKPVVCRRCGRELSGEDAA